MPDQPTTTPTTPAADQRPAGLPENFKTVADLATSYKELQAQNTKLSQKASPDVEIPSEGSSTPVLSAAKEYLENAGKLSEATVKSLAAKGITIEDVTLAAAGAAAKSREINAAITKAAGGEENVKVIMEWAKANLSPAEVEGYNKVIQSGDPFMGRIAFDGLFNQYIEATGIEPSLLRGGESVTSLIGVKPFVSQDEMVKAMSDPKYRDDEAYREEVIKRVHVTPMAGVRG